VEFEQKLTSRADRANAILVTLLGRNPSVGIQARGRVRVDLSDLVSHVDLVPRLLEIRKKLEPWWPTAIVVGSAIPFVDTVDVNCDESDQSDASSVRQFSLAVHLIGLIRTALAGALGEQAAGSNVPEQLSAWAADSESIKRAVDQCRGEPPRRFKRFARDKARFRLAMVQAARTANVTAREAYGAGSYIPGTIRHLDVDSWARDQMMRSLRFDVWRDLNMMRSLQLDVQRDLNSMNRPVTPSDQHQPITPSPHPSFAPVMP
jgi:hypothetical protein